MSDILEYITKIEDELEVVIELDKQKEENNKEAIASLLKEYAEVDDQIKQLTNYKDSLKSELLGAIDVSRFDGGDQKTTIKLNGFSVYKVVKQPSLTLKTEFKEALAIEHPEYFTKSKGSKSWAIRVPKINS